MAVGACCGKSMRDMEVAATVSVAICLTCHRQAWFVGGARINNDMAPALADFFARRDA